MIYLKKGHDRNFNLGLYIIKYINLMPNTVLLGRTLQKKSIERDDITKIRPPYLSTERGPLAGFSLTQVQYKCQINSLPSFQCLLLNHKAKSATHIFFSFKVTRVVHRM